MLDIDTLIANAESETTYDISELFANATAVHERGTLNGNVITRKLTKRELEAERKRPMRMRASGPTLRYKPLKRYQEPIVFASGVVKRMLQNASDESDFVRQFVQHYGVVVPYDKLYEIVQRAWYDNESTTYDY